MGEERPYCNSTRICRSIFHRHVFVHQARETAIYQDHVLRADKKSQIRYLQKKKTKTNVIAGENVTRIDSGNEVYDFITTLFLFVNGPHLFSRHRNFNFKLRPIDRGQLEMFRTEMLVSSYTKF